MAKYRYTGQGEVAIQGLGVMKPDSIVESDSPINHPDFALVTVDPEKTAKGEKEKEKEMKEKKEKSSKKE